MKVKNISSRAHHVGDKVIVPGETAEVPAGYEGAINTAELIEVDDEGDALTEDKPAADAPKKPAKKK